MKRPSVLRALAMFGAALSCSCGTDPRREVDVGPAAFAAADPATADPADVHPAGADPADTADLSRSPVARGVRPPPSPSPQTTEARVRLTAPEPASVDAVDLRASGVTSIDVGTSGDALQLFVAENGALRILESNGATLEDVGTLRLPALTGVTRAVTVRLSPDHEVVLAIAAGQIHVLERDPGGVYVDRTAEVLPGTPPTGVTWISTADLDADGDVDVLVAAAGGVQILDNDGANRLVDRTAELLPPDRPRCQRVFPYDIGRDGVVDLVTVDPEVHLLVNGGRGVFVDESAQRLPDNSSRARALVPVDADDDGEIDVVLLRGLEPDVLWLNDGRGRLVPAADGVMPAVRAFEGVRVDVDDDGTLDLATVGPDGLVLRAVERGHQLRDDSWRLPDDAPNDANEIRAIDVDRDGDVDLVLGRPAGLVILRSDGRGRYIDSSELLLPRRADR